MQNKQNNYSEDEELQSRETLAVCVTSTVINEYVVPIDEVVKDPYYYRDAAHMISNAAEDDIVRYKINSTGGRLDGLLSLLDANACTKAVTVAHIVGECHSAASILALNCQEIIVGPYAEMLVHSPRYGSVGKAADIEALVQHNKRVTEKLFRESYTGFLTEAEIIEIIGGKELYLDSEDIVERLKLREELLNQLENEED